MDAKGKAVGLFVIDGTIGASVVLDVPGRRIAVPVRAAGLGGSFSEPFRWWYESADCSGTPYMLSGPTSDLGTVADGNYNGLSAGKLVYSVPPWVRTEMNSFRRWMPDEDPATASGACLRESVSIGVWGEARVFDATSFVPPFRVE